MNNVTQAAPLRFALLSVVAGAIAVGSLILVYSQTARADITGPVLSLITASSTDVTAEIAWTTDDPSTSQVAYSTALPYSATTTLDSGLVTNHSVILLGLMPSTTYHYQVLSRNSAGTTTMSADRTFITMAVSTTSATSATSTPDLTALQDEVNTLKSQVALLQQQVATLSAWWNWWWNSASSTATSTPGSTSGGHIDQNGRSVRAGTGIDFGGRNFGAEEHVRVMLSGSQVGTAFTNLAGSFSTGSMSIPSTPGTYTYTFVGQRTGITGTATITLTP